MRKPAESIFTTPLPLLPISNSSKNNRPLTTTTTATRTQCGSDDDKESIVFDFGSDYSEGVDGAYEGRQVVLNSLLRYRHMENFSSVEETIEEFKKQNFL